MIRQKVNAYIDIDGVLLTKKMTRPAHAEPFIMFLLRYFNCFWLTTHCRGGVNNTLSYLSAYYPHDIVANLKEVKITDWCDLKTEAINSHQYFLKLAYKCAKKVR